MLKIYFNIRRIDYGTVSNRVIEQRVRIDVVPPFVHYLKINNSVSLLIYSHKFESIDAQPRRELRVDVGSG